MRRNEKPKYTPIDAEVIRNHIKAGYNYKEAMRRWRNGHGFTPEFLRLKAQAEELDKKIDRYSGFSEEINWNAKQMRARFEKLKDVKIKEMELCDAVADIRPPERETDLRKKWRKREAELLGENLDYGN